MLDHAACIITLPAEITKPGRSRFVHLLREFQHKPGQPEELVFPLGDFRWKWRKACVAVKAGRWETMDTGRKPYAGVLLRRCRQTFVRKRGTKAWRRSASCRHWAT